jgi:hypothetical protein
VPVRWLGPVLAATVQPTVLGPGPVPVAPESILIQGALLADVHPQLPVEVTLRKPVLPAAPKFWLVEFRLKLWTPSVAGLENSPPLALLTRYEKEVAPGMFTPFLRHW